jgi:preprotein translocase subunit SecD
MNQNKIFTYLTVCLLSLSLVSLAVLYGLAIMAPKTGKTAADGHPVFTWSLLPSYVLDVKMEADFSRLPPTAKRAEVLERSLKVFTLRTLQNLHAVRPGIKSEGGRFILVHAPGIKNPDLALKLLTQSGIMELKLVDESHALAEFVDLNGKVIPGKLPPTLELLSTAGGERNILERRSLLPENCVEYAVTTKNRAGLPEVGFKLNLTGTAVFKNITSQYTGRKLAVVFNGVVLTVAKISAPITNGQVFIDGDFSREDAEELAQSLQEGLLPFPVKVVEKHVLLVSPLQSLMALLGIHSRTLLAHFFLVLGMLSLLGAGWICVYPLLRKVPQP